MATQYTAGLTTGQVLTAATMNTIGAAWETWTPTITANAGVITASTVNTARYCRLQKLIIGIVDVTITTAGTAAGNQLQFTLPFLSAAARRNIGASREVNATGNLGCCDMVATGTCAIIRYDNVGTIQNNYRWVATFAYEAQ